MVHCHNESISIQYLEYSDYKAQNIRHFTQEILKLGSEPI